MKQVRVDCRIEDVRVREIHGTCFKTRVVEKSTHIDISKVLDKMHIEDMPSISTVDMLNQKVLFGETTTEAKQIVKLAVKDNLIRKPDAFYMFINKDQYEDYIYDRILDLEAWIMS